MRTFARSVLATATVLIGGCLGTFAPGGSGGSGGSNNGSNGGAGAGGSGGSGSSLGAAIDATESAMHALAALNAYRAQNGVAALSLDDQISTFSMNGTQALAAGGPDHGYFVAAGASLWDQGFCASAGENQAPGWNVENNDEDATIDAILASMMGEGPGGGHHDNIVGSQYTRVGVGLIVDGKQRLWFTNDFSAACR